MFLIGKGIMNQNPYIPKEPAFRNNGSYCRCLNSSGCTEEHLDAILRYHTLVKSMCYFNCCLAIFFFFFFWPLSNMIMHIMSLELILEVVLFTWSCPLWNVTGRKVASRKDELRELVEHFNVSVCGTNCTCFVWSSYERTTGRYSSMYCFAFCRLMLRIRA